MEVHILEIKIYYKFGLIIMIKTNIKMIMSLKIIMKGTAVMINMIMTMAIFTNKKIVLIMILFMMIILKKHSLIAV